MLKFYYVDQLYADFLRTYDPKVPALSYEAHDKFFCGVVLKVNEKKYYAPISHDTNRQQTSLLIYDKGRVISSIKFAFMIPVPDNVLNLLDFNTIAQTDLNYANLLRAEYLFCSRHEQIILKKATSVYRIGCNKKHRLNPMCCQFSDLEAHVEEYNKEQKN